MTSRATNGPSNNIPNTFILNDIGNNKFEVKSKNAPNFKTTLTDRRIIDNTSISERIKNFFSFVDNKQTVKIQLTDQNNQIKNLNVRVDDLAKLLGTTSKNINLAHQEDILNAYVNAKLEAQLIRRQAAYEKRLASQPVKKQGAPEKIKDRSPIMKILKDNGIENKDISKLEEYYQKNKKNLDKASTSTVEHRNQTKLSRGILSVPHGPQKGMYVLMKHEKTPEVGIGSFNRATRAINLETGEVFVFRTGSKAHVKENELLGNTLASQHNEFVAGTVIRYKGNMRPRKGRVESKKDQLRQEMNVDKVGILMPYLKGGDLYTKLNGPVKPQLKIQ